MAKLTSQYKEVILPEPCLGTPPAPSRVMKGTLVHINADSLELSASRGPVYGPLTFEIGDGMSVLRGDVGSGRTSLLLTLAGRMKPGAGELTVGEHRLPHHLRAVQKITAVCGFAGIDDLEDSVTVGAALQERRAWLSPWFSLVRKLNDVDVAQVCRPVFGSEPIPHAGTVIWDLSDTQKFLLRITLALMSGPEILFVDDLEQVRSRESRAVLWERLAHIAGGSTAVVVSATSLDADLWDALESHPEIVDMSHTAAQPELVEESR